MSAKFVRIEFLARETNLPRLWLKQEADAGRLPHIRVGPSRMFNVEQVLKVLAERAAMPTQPFPPPPPPPPGDTTTKA